MNTNNIDKREMLHFTSSQMGPPVPYLFRMIMSKCRRLKLINCFYFMIISEYVNGKLVHFICTNTILNQFKVNTFEQEISPIQKLFITGAEGDVFFFSHF